MNISHSNALLLLSVLWSTILGMNVICALTDLIACQDRAVINSEKSNTILVDVCLGMTIKLFCNYCNEEDDYKSKLWYYKKRGSTDMMKEIVTIETGQDFKRNNIAIAPTHTLILEDFKVNDSGIYVCKYYKSDDKIAFTYVLDGVFRTKMKPKLGTITEWQDFKVFVLNPLNEKISKVKKEPYIGLQDNIKFKFEIKFVWENNMASNVFVRHTGKRKIGKCRLRPISHLRGQNNNTINNITTYYLYDNYDVPCRSIILNETFPEISRIVRKIPEYELIDKSEKFLTLAKNNVMKKKNIKRNTTKVLENGHITFVCPDVTDADIKWYKNNILLNTSFRNNMADQKEEPHSTIDSYGSLQLLHVTKNEDGIYKCVLGDRTIHKWYLEVVSNTKLLNEDFIRYSIYLGFVLSLTITCYCAGVCVAWHRRASFADPLNFYVKKKYCQSYSDLEELIKLK